MIDLRFPTSLQIMLSLALAEEEGARNVTSSLLAEGLGANPSFVRKLLVPLVGSGLVESTMGKNGGVQLGRPASQITLRDVYCAVIGEKKLWSPRLDVPHRCLVSSNVQRFFESLADDAEAAVLEVLASRTLKRSLARMRRLADRPTSPKTRQTA
jgi:Rrf2 family transcriptional regulator, repressor of oqxAB